MKQHTEPAGREWDALVRLVKIAQGDTGQSGRVADFLLAWWNAGSCGGFDFTNFWAVDTAVALDMLAVVGLIATHHNYPDTYGLGPAFERIVAAWRPELLEEGGAEPCPR